MASTFLRVSRPLRQAAHYVKATTGITGLEVHPNPLPALQSTFKETLSLLEAIPSSSVYRQGVEAITNHKLKVVENSQGDVKAVENQLGEGQIEEVLQVAKIELNLVGKMIEWKAWEPLQDKPPAAQWEYFKSSHASS
ncbi:hypothetical protein FRC03_008774 [Tulasnella sp. 419]|nr:hypothetical protein FRC02_004468 [Tulasnella sp. 418]KAG8968075.1 hypothetical protein FRC03_008774 [Tulasnella sp. 419]